MSKPRCAHYQLAHVALPSVAHRSPFEFMSAMASDSADELLRSLLEQIAEHCADERPDFVAGDVVIHRARVLGSPCVVLELPPPTSPTEAHFVAAWLAINDGPEPGQLRYFTLEAADASHGPSTLLGEWDREHRHVTHGAGPESSVEGFTRAITALVARYH